LRLVNAIDPRAFSRSFELVATRAVIRVTSHMLRHGAATRLVHAGVPPQVISRVLGHASTRELDVYAHSLPAAEAAAMDTLGGE
jgi:integrase